MEKQSESGYGPVVQTVTMPRKSGKQPRISQKLEQGIVIPKGSRMMYVGAAGYKIAFGTPVYEILIGIGTDNHATLLIAEEAYDAMMAGAKISIEH